MGYMPAMFVKWEFKLSESNVFVFLYNFCPTVNMKSKLTPFTLLINVPDLIQDDSSVFIHFILKCTFLPLKLFFSFLANNIIKISTLFTLNPLEEMSGPSYIITLFFTEHSRAQKGFQAKSHSSS